MIFLDLIILNLCKDRFRPVETRDAVTLHTLIQCFILPGTTISSDCWSSYVTRTGTSLIERLPENYQHLTVNHSINFVDPHTGAHTQAIESLWQKYKLR